MQPDQRNEKGGKDAKSAQLDKGVSHLKTVGEVGAGLLFLATLLGFLWTNKTWLLWLTLILLPPIVAYLFSKRRKWSKVKQIVSVAIAIIVPVGIGAYFWTSLTRPAIITWLPPYLSNGCQQVEVAIGGNSQNINILVLTNGGTRFDPMGNQACYFFVSNNTLFVDVSVNTGRKPVTIKAGRVFNLPEGWDCNYDSNKFEIVNENSFPVYQCRYPVAEKVEIDGCLLGSGSVIAVKRGGGTIGRLDFDPFELGLKPIFHYPSKANVGRLAAE